jgi:hypothetical protein
MNKIVTPHSSFYCLMLNGGKMTTAVNMDEAPILIVEDTDDHE